MVFPGFGRVGGCKLTFASHILCTILFDFPTASTSLTTAGVDDNHSLGNDDDAYSVFVLFS